MLALTNPREAYGRTNFEARILSGDTSTLVHLCFEQVTSNLGTAILCADRTAAQTRNKALTRTLTALIALELGIDANAPLAPALRQLYQAARRAVLDSVSRFDADRLRAIRADFLEIDAAMHRGE